jgi:cephalosporin-C deacetylase-like acetyl esterase
MLLRLRKKVITAPEITPVPQHAYTPRLYLTPLRSPWRHCLVIGLLLLLCTALSLPTLAVPPPEEEVTITAIEGGGYQIVAATYRARIGADGNLHSLQVNGVEFLDDRITGSAGASFFVTNPVTLSTMTLQDNTITATDGVFTVRYEFYDGFINLVLRQASANGAAYAAVCSPLVAYVEHTETGDVATTPADYDWADVVVAVPTGEYIELQGGSRIWGRALGRQIWERSDIAPSKEYTLTVIPGRSAPRSPGLAQLVTLAADVNAQNSLVPAGRPVELQVRFENNANQAVQGQLTVHVASSTGTVLLHDRKPLACDPHQSAVEQWTLTPTAPDFYTVSCTMDLGSGQRRVETTFGYDADAIRPPVVTPIDFAAYWQRAVAEAQSADVKLIRLEDRAYSTNTVTVYRLGLEFGESVTCFGWLAVPKFPGRYPLLFVLPSDRVRTLSPYAALANYGLVVASIEPTGQPVDGQLEPLIERAHANLHDPQSCGLRTITVRYLAAMHALAQLPSVDANRIAVTGVGFGGAMAFILAALDVRVQAAAPDVPNYCCIAWGQGMPDWPYRSLLGEQPEAALATLRYFDVANFAEHITCPVLVSAGARDTYSRPANIYGVMNRLPGPRIMKLYPGGHEGGGAKHWEVKLQWLGQVLGGPSPLLPGAGTAAP